MKIDYAIIVKNKTRLEVLIERFNTKAQAKFYIESAGGNFDDYEMEHETFWKSLSLLQRKLSKVIKNKIVERSFLPSFLFNEKQLVVVLGQDGLVANTAKYVNGIPIVAVNPDSERYDGVLLPYDTNNFLVGVEKVINNQSQIKSVHFAEARLNDGQRLLAFNDLFIGASSHISARYKLTYGKKTEAHSSSGIIVSTKAGSTGWLSSVFNMAFGLKNIIEQSNEAPKYTTLREEELFFAVREPFASLKTQTNIVGGIIDRHSKVIVESSMPDNGIIFSDGIEADFLHFNAGSTATIGLAKEKACLVM